MALGSMQQRIVRLDEYPRVVLGEVVDELLEDRVRGVGGLGDAQVDGELVARVVLAEAGGYTLVELRLEALDRADDGDVRDAVAGETRRYGGFRRGGEVAEAVGWSVHRRSGSSKGQIASGGSGFREGGTCSLLTPTNCTTKMPRLHARQMYAAAMTTEDMSEAAEHRALARRASRRELLQRAKSGSARESVGEAVALRHASSQKRASLVVCNLS